METLWQDVRYACRTLRKNPRFTFITVLTLSLGIGANTAIFSVVDSVILRSLPYKDSNRLSVLWTCPQTNRDLQQRTSVPNFEDWRTQSVTFEDMAFHEGTSHGTLVDSRSDGADPEVT